MNDLAHMCLCGHTLGFHWHRAEGVLECSDPTCPCRKFFDPQIADMTEFIVPPRCLACNHPESVHVRNHPNRYCDEGLCCCTNYVASPAQLGRYQRMHPGANA